MLGDHIADRIERLADRISGDKNLRDSVLLLGCAPINIRPLVERARWAGNQATRCEAAGLDFQVVYREAVDVANGRAGRDYKSAFDRAFARALRAEVTVDDEKDSP